MINIEHVIESALFSSDEPLSLEQLSNLFDDLENISMLDIQQALEKLKQHYLEHSIALKETASGFQFQVRSEFAPYIQRLWEEKPQTYSKAVLETLAIIAYRQPVTRGDIEEIRGVVAHSYMIKTLMEHGWIRRIGHREVAGRPTLYATTKKFLDYFGLKSLEELPVLEDFKEQIKQNPETISLFKEEE